MASTKEILKQFSVSEDEAEIYLALLKLGMASVSEIAKKIQKNRTATYFHINKLLEKDLLHESKQGRALMFTATEPTELAERFDRLTTDFKSLVPQLEALKKAEIETPRVQVSESRAGYYKVYDEISSLPEGSTFLAIEGVTALKNELSLLTNEETKNFYSKMVARNIEVKLVITEQAAQITNKLITKENLALLRQRKINARTLPESILPFQGLTLIYGNTVAHLFPDTNLVVTTKHQGIAESSNATFNALFILGKPYSFTD